MADADKEQIQRQAEAVRIRAEQQGAAELVLAEKQGAAVLAKSDKEAQAKKLLAEGVIAEESATGLANVRVQEAEANAIEMRGKAEANAGIEKHKAEAFGIEQSGQAEAKAIDLKADAMKKFDGVGREHEEFKLQLQKQERVELAGIDVQRQIAEAQARVLGEAVRQAKIDIVGGDGTFLENFFRSISLAKSVDGFVDKSEQAQRLVGGDDANIATQLAELISRAGIASEDIKNLSIANLLAKLGSKGGGQGLMNKIEDLLGKAGKK